MSMNTDEKERVQEELYDETLLDQYLENVILINLEMNF